MAGDRQGLLSDECVEEVFCCPFAPRLPSTRRSPIEIAEVYEFSVSKYYIPSFSGSLEEKEGTGRWSFRSGGMRV